MLDKLKGSYITNTSIAIGAVVGIAVLLVVIGVDTSKIASEVVTAKNELKTGIEQLKVLAQLRDEAKIADQKFATLENILPKKDDLFSFPAKMEELAKSKGLLSTFSFGAESEGSIQYSFVVQNGTFEEIFRFVKTIEEDQIFMSINSLDMVLGGEGYNGTINGVLFFDG